jgi:hypothetical protein
VVTAGADRVAHVWNAATGELLCNPLQHKSDVTSASFSQDGSQIVTTSADNTARLWDARNEQSLRSGTASNFQAPTPLPEADWLAQFCAALSGLSFSKTGELNPLSTDERRQALDQMRALPPTSNWWDALRQWYFNPQRTASPDSPQTMRAAAERERERGTRESLRNALNADLTVPLAHLLLARALMREDAEKQRRGEWSSIDPSLAQQTAFLRRFDLDQLAADEGKIPAEEAAKLWAQAATILLETPDAKVGVGPKPTTCREEARRAARQAVALAPQLAAAQSALKKAGE